MSNVLEKKDIIKAGKLVMESLFLSSLFLTLT